MPKMDLDEGERPKFLVDLLNLVFSYWREAAPGLKKSSKSRGR